MELTLHHYVSIHAPARGATRLIIPPFLNVIVSIHAPARGATTSHSAINSSFVVFQSTHPRGVRLFSRTRSFERNNGFNPRTRAGCDQVSPVSLYKTCCFNPRTRAGCDFLKRCDFMHNSVSIHAPARGATVSMLIDYISIYYFLFCAILILPTKKKLKKHILLLQKP